jgi:RNA recognition motif-containing protein
MTESQVLALFPHRDLICRSAFPRFPGGGRLRGFAFISYPTWGLCEEALNLLHMTNCRGRKLVIRVADPRQLDGHRHELEQLGPPPPPPPAAPRPSDRPVDSDPGVASWDDRPAGLDVQALIATLIARKLQRPDPRRFAGRDLSHLSREELIGLLDQSRRVPPTGNAAGSSSPGPLEPAAQGLLSIPMRDAGPVYFEDEE